MSHSITIRCDICGATHSSSAADSVGALRDVIVQMSWSRVRWNGRVIDMCGVCGVREMAPNAPGRRCGSCEGGELFDVLGHDRIGHRLANALLRAGIDNLELLSSFSARQLRDLDGIGAVSAHHALNRLHSTPNERRS
ncbi:helix-hairpin-helix domain-containing protein [Streptomyces malaysiensis]|uniref:helix-hairpin-helix domain-containing protein n=1 Tax=Streptomyces malaysiensis TaxID=92644 RepID=UPI002B291706|nr:helix-hairpin-helix domain-containing protein [Streptomyces malaysiensis]